MTVEYDGTDYFGWQVQPGVPTIQGKMNEALARLLRPGFSLTGASRTDRGVHAEGQVVSLRAGNERSPEEIRSALNGILPRDIYVRDISVEADGFNARRSARAKRYVYTLVKGRAPLLSRFAWEYLGRPLDMGLLQDMARALVGERDMANLSPGHERENTVVRILSAEWTENGKMLRFSVEGDRFLYRLVRNMVGMMVAVASGRVEKETFQRAMDGQEVRIITAPARGLCLKEVFYEK